MSGRGWVPSAGTARPHRSGRREPRVLSGHPHAPRRSVGLTGFIVGSGGGLQVNPAEGDPERCGVGLLFAPGERGLQTASRSKVLSAGGLPRPPRAVGPRALTARRPHSAPRPPGWARPQGQSLRVRGERGARGRGRTRSCESRPLHSDRETEACRSRSEQPGTVGVAHEAPPGRLPARAARLLGRGAGPGARGAAGPPSRGHRGAAAAGARREPQTGGGPRGDT